MLLEGVALELGMYPLRCSAYCRLPFQHVIVDSITNLVQGEPWSSRSSALSVVAQDHKSLLSTRLHRGTVHDLLVALHVLYSVLQLVMRTTWRHFRLRPCSCIEGFERKTSIYWQCFP